MNTADVITVEATVRVTPREAWEAYTTPESITRWNQASADWHCPSAAVDLRKDGRYLARMEAKDGSMGFDFAGHYEAVEFPNCLVLRLDDGRGVRTTFEAVEDGTLVRTIFDPDAAAPISVQRDGWQAILNSYAAYVTDRT